MNNKNAELINYQYTDNIINDAKWLIETARTIAHRYVNLILVQRNWMLGQRIALEELKGKGRAEYGAEVIKSLSDILTKEYGKGFTQRSLYNYLQFYKYFPEILHSLSAKTSNVLNWTHYRILLQEKNPQARAWYAHEAYTQTWSVRTLQRNIYSQYYFRLLMSQDKKPVEEEMKQLTADYQQDKLEFIKNPVISPYDTG